MAKNPKRARDRAPIGDDEQRIRVGKRTVIFKRSKSPNWYIAYRVDAEPIRYSLNTPDIKAAIAKAEEKDVQLRSGQEGAPIPRLKIAEVKEKYLKSLQRRARRAGTLDGYERDLRQFVEFARFSGVVFVDRITVQLIEQYQDLLEDKGVVGIVPQKKLGRRIAKNKPKTVRNKLKTIKQMLKWAHRKGLIRKDPAFGFDLPPEPDEQANCWTPTELQAILAHAEAPWLDVFNFLPRTGLRPDEFCWLMKEDLNLEGKSYLKVRSKVCPFTGILWQPKSKRSTRIVPLCREAAEIARRAYESSPGPWLFYSTTATSKQKGRYRVDAIWRALQRTKKKAGVGRGTTHTFRHVFCSTAANSGVPPFQVMKIMGHSSLDIVLIYYHVNDDELLSTAERLNFDPVLKGVKSG